MCNKEIVNIILKVIPINARVIGKFQVDCLKFHGSFARIFAMCNKEIVNIILKVIPINARVINSSHNLSDAKNKKKQIPDVTVRKVLVLYSPHAYACQDMGLSFYNIIVMILIWCMLLLVTLRSSL
jgi:hypothetical protein